MQASQQHQHRPQRHLPPCDLSPPPRYKLLVSLPTCMLSMGAPTRSLLSRQNPSVHLFCNTCSK